MTSREEGTTPSRWSVARQWRACAAAFTFFTRIPAGWFGAHSPEDLADAPLYVPLVGLVVAGCGAAVYAMSALLWPAMIAVVLSVAATVWVTGAFHEDALADSLDGFGGGWNPTQILAIMKDSRVGSYALVGMFVMLLLKVSALVTIADASMPSAWSVFRALAAGHILGRWSSVMLMARYPYVRPDDPAARISAGRTLVHAVTPVHVTIVTLLSLALLLPVAGVRVIPTGFVAVLGTWGAGAYVHRRLGGITGDALGAANQVVEVCVYLVLASRLVVQW